MFSVLTGYIGTKFTAIHTQQDSVLNTWHKDKGVQLTTDTFQLITAITTVIIIVAFPLFRDAVSIEACELGIVTPCTIVHDAMLFIVGQIPVALMWTLALSTIWTWKKRKVGPKSKTSVKHPFIFSLPE